MRTASTYLEKISGGKRCEKETASEGEADISDSKHFLI